ncbi:MAG: gamma-glutamyl-gamma-aminobutyrate hydrolase family protein [Bacteriovoracia bacterium]
MIHIGISACFMYPDPGRTVFGKKTLAYLEQDMARFISRPGIMPVLIPDLGEEEMKAFMQEMDGFIFQGGSDLASSTYKEAPIENGRWPGDPYRDQYELKIMDYAFKNKKPVLGICRGLQLINVYFGGTLHQDLQTTLNTPIEHRNAELYDKVHHQVICTEKSLLKDIYGLNELNVNSVHHQGVKTLGKDLIVDAISPDDQLIEAFHYKNLQDNYVVAVQWHPEFSHTLKGKLTDPDPLYHHFLNTVKNLRKA